MLAPSKIGLPYGVIPRLMMAWMTTEAVSTKQRELVLGDSMSEFMGSARYDADGRPMGQHHAASRSVAPIIYDLGQLLLRGSKCGKGEWPIVTYFGGILSRPLSRVYSIVPSPYQSAFYEEVRTSPVPIDMRAKKALKKSPLALDVYFLLTYRLSYLRQPRITLG